MHPTHLAIFTYVTNWSEIRSFKSPRPNECSSIVNYKHQPAYRCIYLNRINIHNTQCNCIVIRQVVHRLLRNNESAAHINRQNAQGSRVPCRRVGKSNVPA